MLKGDSDAIYRWKFIIVIIIISTTLITIIQLQEYPIPPPVLVRHQNSGWQYQMNKERDQRSANKN